MGSRRPCSGAATPTWVWTTATNSSSCGRCPAAPRRCAARSTRCTRAASRRCSHVRSQPRSFRAFFVTAVAVADNPWDQATKGGFPTNETAAAIADARRMTAILEETNAVGVFGDGNGGGNGVMSRFFRNGVAAQHPAALQSEGGGSPDSMMNFTTVTPRCTRFLSYCACVLLT